jgi:hypothetical protein
LTLRLKVGIVERIDVPIVRQRRRKHISAATDNDATVEDMVFSVRSVPRLYWYDEDELDKRNPNHIYKRQTHFLVRGDVTEGLLPQGFPLKKSLVVSLKGLRQD